MFRQDPKPFQATLDAAKGALAEQQARLQVANDNLARVKPLTALKALSQKDLDDATGSSSRPRRRSTRPRPMCSRPNSTWAIPPSPPR